MTRLGTTRACLQVAFAIAVCWIATTTGHAGVVNVLSLDSTRVIDFATSPGFSVLRNDLLNPSLFGPTGVVSDSVNLLSPVSEITTARLAGVDVVLLAGAYPNPTTSEIAALQSFVAAGGGVLFFGNGLTGVSPLVGATPGPEYPYGSTATIIDSASPMASGPFGSLGAGTQFGTMAHGVLSSSGPNGVVGISTSEGAFGITYEIGLGKVALFGDEEIFLIGPDKTYPSEIPHRVAMRKQMMAAAISFQAC